MTIRSKSYAGIAPSTIVPGNVALGGENMGQVPLFAVLWCPSRTHIWAGYTPADGQELDKNLFPDATDGVEGGMVPTVTQANWDADVANRASYVSTSSAGKFRMPDLNGVTAGNKAAFLRGDGNESGGVDGQIQEDSFKEHNHVRRAEFNKLMARAADINNQGTTVGIDSGNATGEHRIGAMTTELWNDSTILSEGGSETRPTSAVGCWVVKLFGVVVNPGAANAAQLATAIAALSGLIGGGGGGGVSVTDLTENGVDIGLPGGLKVKVKRESFFRNVRYNFVAPFEEYCIGVWPMVSTTKPTGVGYRWVSNIDAGGFTLRTGGDNTFDGFYIAIGK